MSTIEEQFEVNWDNVDFPTKFRAVCNTCAAIIEGGCAFPNEATATLNGLMENHHCGASS